MARVVDSTFVMTIAGNLHPRLAQLGYRAIQAVDDRGRDRAVFVVPPLVTITAGPFFTGSDRRDDPAAYDDELPRRRLTLATFHIARYPITVAEYSWFLAASEHEPPSCWQDQLCHPDHPVVAITWRDVMSYALWLRAMSGHPWRLPTDAEWEKAARGPAGRVYPWGNHFRAEVCNTQESGVQAATPVGAYPAGASPYGVHDMAGNVWEWSWTVPDDFNFYRDPVDEYGERKLFYHRVQRGGSWSDDALHARSALLTWDAITASNRAVGVRLALGWLADFPVTLPDLDALIAAEEPEDEPRPILECGTCLL